MDTEKTAGGGASFWRCGHCGARFLGPKVLEKKRRHHRSHSRDPLAESLGFSRLAKRWVFPLLVIVVTALLVGLILEMRNRDIPRPIITPGR
jgi:hypothetical protein